MSQPDEKLVNQPPQIPNSYAGALFCMSFFIPWYRLCPVFCCLFWFFLRFERWRKRSHLLYFWVVIEICVFISVYFPNSEVGKKICKKKDKTLSNNFVMLESKSFVLEMELPKWNRYQYGNEMKWIPKWELKSINTNMVVSVIFEFDFNRIGSNWKLLLACF